MKHYSTKQWDIHHEALLPSDTGDPSQHHSSVSARKKLKNFFLRHCSAVAHKCWNPLNGFFTMDTVDGIIIESLFGLYHENVLF